jgi:hypothetical protein
MNYKELINKAKRYHTEQMEDLALGAMMGRDGDIAKKAFNKIDTYDVLWDACINAIDDSENKINFLDLFREIGREDFENMIHLAKGRARNGESNAFDFKSMMAHHLHDVIINDGFDCWNCGMWEDKITHMLNAA